jgi:hypothetical protein
LSLEKKDKEETLEETFLVSSIQNTKKFFLVCLVAFLNTSICGLFCSAQIFMGVKVLEERPVRTLMIHRSSANFSASVNFCSLRRIIIQAPKGEDPLNSSTTKQMKIYFFWVFGLEAKFSSPKQKGLLQSRLSS